VRQQLDAVAFDLDGTLYPNYRFYIRLLPFIAREHRLLRAMGSARDVLRSAARGGRFYDLQAELMAGILRSDIGDVRDRTDRLIYRGWEPLFKGIKLYSGVRETLAAFRADGLKLGLLSDFPPDAKLVNLGLPDAFDAALCSETFGRLKPDPVSFRALSERLGVEAGRILYVGNSVRYDVAGAKAAGFRSALIRRPGWRSGQSTGGADFIFSSYRQLRRFVLT
jgi:putative hydrolase of the HAD superfamily